MNLKDARGWHKSERMSISSRAFCVAAKLLKNKKICWLRKYVLRSGRIRLSSSRALGRVAQSSASDGGLSPTYYITLHQVNTTIGQRQRQKQGVISYPLMQLGSDWSPNTRDIGCPSNWMQQLSQSSSSGRDQLQLSGLGRLRPLLCQRRDFLCFCRCHTIAL